MTILTAHQSVYLPWLGLFHKIALADKFVYFDDVQYQKRDWNNRNKVKTANGEVMLSVPVYSKNHFDTKLKDVLINNQAVWRRKHLKTISNAYKKAPYYDKYINFFKDIYSQDWRNLSELNEYVLRKFMDFLGINIPFYKLSDFGLTSKKSDLVLDMCKAMKADLYIFGALGKDYASEDAFREEGIQIYFQEYRHPQYRQLHGGEFLPYMSVVDVLFNHGEQSLSILMSGNKTKEELVSEKLQRV